ncbi:MAG TPA: hypothetical protein VMY99_05155 [Nevskiaceae bacterium]|nr:hypothetical protein [Nevskiaceae bacterium]
MNKLRNPNHLLMASLVTLALGTTACQAEGGVSGPGADNYIPPPSCAVQARIKGKTANIGLTTQNMGSRGITSIDSIGYDFGDGAVDNDGTMAGERHQYTHPGHYAINATVGLTPAPGTTTAGNKAGIITCTTNIVTVR